MAFVFLSLGSNKGNRFKNLIKAINNIQNQIGSIEKFSDVFETESWNYVDNNYLNSVLKIKTSLKPLQLLEKCLNIEKDLGRNKKTELLNGIPNYLPRKIDIDILFYDNKIIKSEELTIPHPKLHLRNFVLKPLMQIEPDFIHPEFNEKIHTLYIRSKDKGKITLFKKIKKTDFIIP